jgi:hypothetical protein
MIRPGPPPGTDIVCIDALPGPFGLTGLSKGAYYSVQAIEKSIFGGFVVFLNEIRGPVVFAIPYGLLEVGYSLRRFRYLNDLSYLIQKIDCCEKDTLQKNHV